MANSHYVPAICEHNGPKRKAVCGKWIPLSEHSAEPDCDSCRQWLEADAATAAELTTKYGEDVQAQAEALFGEAPVDIAHVQINTFDPLEHYKARKGMR